MSIVRTNADLDALASAAAEHFMDIAVSSIDAHGRFSVALSGGSTPRLTYDRLATQESSSRVDWSHVHLFWGDERCVPPDHPDSNYGMVRTALLDRIPIPSANVHRVEGEIEAAKAAARYEETLRQFFSRAGQEETRTFDPVLLGMGTPLLCSPTPRCLMSVSTGLRYTTQARPTDGGSPSPRRPSMQRAT